MITFLGTAELADASKPYILIVRLLFLSL